MEKRKRRQKSCCKIALARARQARRQKKHPILIGWVFIAALLSVRSSISSPNMTCLNDTGYDWPISDYERGYLRSLKPRRERYIEQPTMKRLMCDLRRPAAREDATQYLLARIDDLALREWLIEQIRNERINRLAVHVRPSMGEAMIIASWQAELDVEHPSNDEAVLTHQTPRQQY